MLVLSCLVHFYTQKNFWADDEVMLNVLGCRLTYQGQTETNAEARFNKSLRPRKPEGSLGRTAQDIHLDSRTAPELWAECRVLYLNTAVSGWMHSAHPIVRSLLPAAQGLWSGSIAVTARCVWNKNDITSDPTCKRSSLCPAQPRGQQRAGLACAAA